MASRSPEPVPPRRPRLVLEIAIVLAIKVLLLFGIWIVWFSQPAIKNMQLPADTVVRRLLTTQAADGHASKPESGPSTQVENPRE